MDFLQIPGYPQGTGSSIPDDVKALPEHLLRQKRKSNVRWSRQASVFTTGFFPSLTWDLYQYNPDMVGNKDRDPTPEDFFKTIKQLGAGTFGTVKLVETHVTGERLAMKIMDKSKCRSKIRNRELKAHILVGPCPFIVRYHSCFQTEYHPGGSLAKFMDENGHFDVPTTRDIKLTNMLLGTDNHVRLCDLGLCKLGITSDKKTHSRCGALRYSVLQKRPYGKEVDWWSMGVVLYRMLTGLTTSVEFSCAAVGHCRPFSLLQDVTDSGGISKTTADWNVDLLLVKFLREHPGTEAPDYPFDARRDPDLVEKKILTEEPDYSHISNFTAQDLIMAWLKKTQCERLGYGDTEEEDIRGHAFFSTIDWEELRTRHTEPPSVHRRYMRRASAQRQLERAADEDSDRMGGQVRGVPVGRKVVAAIVLAIELISRFLRLRLDTVHPEPVLTDSSGTTGTSVYRVAVLLCHSDKNKPVLSTLDALKKFLEDNSGKLVVIDFFAQWCGPCKMIGPKVVQMAKEMDTVAFAKVDVDELEEVAQQYEVSAMPTFIFIRNCQKFTLEGNKRLRKAFSRPALYSVDHGALSQSLGVGHARNARTSQLSNYKESAFRPDRLTLKRYVSGGFLLFVCDRLERSMWSGGDYDNESRLM
ncbi:hypothetical protein BaRGS_00013662 [Batillaria attramentaria]|uniref:Uncharacterized protein n=1 Tax=Batillaria attramentaria TaxID=370345 RepID=A0ABD0L6N0_9CAEN